MALLLKLVLADPTDRDLYDSALPTFEAHPEAAIMSRLHLATHDEVAEFIDRMAIRLRADQLAALDDALHKPDPENHEPLSAFQSGLELVSDTLEVARTELRRIATMRMPQSATHVDNELLQEPSRGSSPITPVAAIDRTARDTPSLEELLASAPDLWDNGATQIAHRSELSVALVRTTLASAVLAWNADPRSAAASWCSESRADRRRPP